MRPMLTNLIARALYPASTPRHAEPTEQDIDLHRRVLLVGALRKALGREVVRHLNPEALSAIEATINDRIDKARNYQPRFHRGIKIHPGQPAEVRTELLSLPPLSIGGECFHFIPVGIRSHGQQPTRSAVEAVCRRHLQDEQRRLFSAIDYFTTETLHYERPPQSYYLEVTTLLGLSSGIRFVASWGVERTPHSFLNGCHAAFVSERLDALLFKQPKVVQEAVLTSALASLERSQCGHAVPHDIVREALSPSTE